MKVKDLTKLVFYIVRDFLGEHLPSITMIFVVVTLEAPVIKVEVDSWACKEIHYTP